MREEDCGTTNGIWVRDISPERAKSDPIFERIAGRISAENIVVDGKVLVAAGSPISDDAARQTIAAGVAVKMRSVLVCEAREGVCRTCYGRNLATGKIVEIGEAVGVIAAQSIGEPGTQLTMRTFHTGGQAGVDITQGLPRVEELFEARIPKGKAIISEIDGELDIIRAEGSRKVRVTSKEEFEVSYPVDPKMQVLVKNKDDVMEGQELARDAKGNGIRTRHVGKVTVSAKEITVRTVDEEVREYPIPHQVRIRPELDRRDGQKVVIKAGQQITEGSISPQELLHILGKEAVQTFLVDEVQKVYRSQGVDINDKHIEVIVRQMMRKVRIDSAGRHGPAPWRDRFAVGVRGGQRKGAGGRWRTGHGPDGSARPDQGRTEHHLMALGGLFPGDHARPHRGRDLRQDRQAARAEGERDHRQAHPGRHRARLLQEAA